MVPYVVALLLRAVCPHCAAADGGYTYPSPRVLVEQVPGNGQVPGNDGVPVHHASELETQTGSLGADLPPVQLSYSDIRFSVDVQKTKEQGGGIEKRQILRGCSGVFQPGRLTAVMGASGAGKTSLLNLVSGHSTAGAKSGSLRLNSQEVSLDDMMRVRELSAYIQQDDILLGSMTVREAVTLSARLRLPKSMSDSEKLERVERVLGVLGLMKCGDTVIGDAFNKGISGGEKRRTSIALELIKSPSILFLDEPTSGLDTYTAFSIVSLLREVAHEQNKTIVCTIHQPSSDIWAQFDDLVLLAHGSVMYHGPAAHVVDYFARCGYPCPENFNPADHLFMSVLYSMNKQLALISADMAGSAASPRKGAITAANEDQHEGPAFKVPDTVAAAEEGSALVQARDAASAYELAAKEEDERVAGLLKQWQESSECSALQKHVDNPLSSPLPDPSVIRAERPGQLYAFQLLAARRWRDLLRDKMKLRVQFAQYLFFAIVLGLIFLQLGKSQKNVQDRQGCLFFVCVQATFMSFMSNLNTFGPEKLVMQREMESGLYNLPAFFFSRWIVEVPFRVIFPFIYSTITYWMIGFQQLGDNFILFAIALILIDNCGTNMSIMICSLFPDVQQAMQAGPAFVLPLMVFAGFYVQLDSIGWWFRWITYISPIRYGFVATVKNELEGLTFECPPAPAACAFPTGERAIQQLGIEDEGSVGINLVWNLLLVIGFLSMAFLLMWRSTRKRS